MSPLGSTTITFQRCRVLSASTLCELKSQTTASTIKVDDFNELITVLVVAGATLGTFSPEERQYFRALTCAWFKLLQFPETRKFSVKVRKERPHMGVFLS